MTNLKKAPFINHHQRKNLLLLMPLIHPLPKFPSAQESRKHKTTKSLLNQQIKKCKPIYNTEEAVCRFTKTQKEKAIIKSRKIKDLIFLIYKL